jgi:hypothetical protein
MIESLEDVFFFLKEIKKKLRDLGNYVRINFLPSLLRKYRKQDQADE